MYRSYTGTLPAFIRAPPGDNRALPYLCRSLCGPRLFSVPSRLSPVQRRSLPVLPGDSRFEV
ncbi:hypothetical protein DPMN_059053 [Dreissena polymorpha]|uniref:Uncharacterized protein n=1 Tax=Dreissena polymorpha TaxID=45954 RepID=A0A9D4C391_DREPO|nr:hypothetical protein DPMN_059053 [Dreissena polymorpha]